MRTKTTILKTLSALVIAGVIFITSCKKDSNSSTTSGNNTSAQNLTTSGATSDDAYGDAFNVALQAGSDNNLNSITAESGGVSTNSVRTVNGINGYYCANVTLKTTAGTFPDTLIVDFGTGCTSSGDGIARSGSITYIFSGKLGTTGTVISATFDNYTVNGYKLGGSYSITNTSPIGGYSLTTQVQNGTITNPNDSSYSFYGTKTLSLNLPIDTTFLNNTFNITGGYTISNTNTGESLTATVNTPLLKKLSCQYIVSGVIGFAYTKGSAISVNGTLDYGDGTCDNTAVVTIGTYVKTVTLPL